jgi:hypothetical protein
MIVFEYEYDVWAALGSLLEIDNMNSELAYGMACIATGLANNMRLETIIIEKLLVGASLHPNLKAIVQLLCLYFETKEDWRGKSSKRHSLEMTAKVLEILTPLVEANQLLGHLIHREYDEFDQYCLNHVEPGLKELRLHAHGLYPQADTDWPTSIFSRYADKSIGGNPHWVITRYAVKQWFILNKDKLGP